MRPLKFPIFLALITIALSALACGGSFTTANVGDAWMATDIEGANRTTVFSQEDDFYAFVELRNAPDDTQLKAVWTGVDIEGEEPNIIINETEFTSGDDTIYFQLFNDQLWPVGSYKVDIYLNGELATTMTFQVQ